MITKKQSLLLSYLLLANFLSMAFDMPDFVSLGNMIEIEDDSFFAEDEGAEAYTPDRVVKALTRSCDDDEDGIIESSQFLRLDFYKRTNPINQRSILDLPQFYFFHCPPPQDVCKSWQLFVQPFANRTGEVNFTRDDTMLGSYLAFSNALVFSPILEGFDFNIPEIISLVEKFKVQEHRGGVMLGSLRKMDNWYLQVRTPLIYQERNYSLDESDEQRLRKALGTLEDDIQEEDEFNREHFVADRLGIGDTRLNLGYVVKDCPTFYFACGLESTIPSAFTIKEGLYGNHFSKDQPDPKIDLCKLLNLIGEGELTEVEQIGADFLVQVVDRLSRILLETGPGNNGHLGLGAFVFTDMCIMDKLTFQTRAAVEYLLPAPERRYFIKKKCPEDFDRLINPDPANCKQDIQFIEEQIINTFFPSGFDTVVFPGFLFKLTTALSGSFANRWQIMLGHDLWWQQQEKLGSINALKKERDMLRKNLARRSAAIQSKIFASATMFNKGDCCDWSLSFYGDRTFLRSGIGKDFNISVRFEWLL